jgi:hypothetical protein
MPYLMGLRHIRVECRGRVRRSSVLIRSMSKGTGEFTHAKRAEWGGAGGIRTHTVAILSRVSPA